MTIELENLALIPILLEEVKKLNAKLETVSVDLRSGTQVMRYLDVSKTTLFRLVKEGKLKEGIHYKKTGGKVEYIPDGIVEFKKEYIKHLKGQHSSTVNLEKFIGKLAA